MMRMLLLDLQEKKSLLFSQLESLKIKIKYQKSTTGLKSFIII